jgi:hypothetical protein
MAPGSTIRFGSRRISRLEFRDQRRRHYVRVHFAPGRQRRSPPTNAQSAHRNTGTVALAAPETPDLIPLEGSGLEVRVHAKPGNFGIVVSTDDYGARIDAIVVQRGHPPAPGDAGQEQEGEGGGTDARRSLVCQ